MPDVFDAATGRPLDMTALDLLGMQQSGGEELLSSPGKFTLYTKVMPLCISGNAVKDVIQVTSACSNLAEQSHRTLRQVHSVHTTHASLRLTSSQAMLLRACTRST